MTPRPARLPGPPVRAVLFDYGHTLATFSRPGSALLQAYGDIGATLRGRLKGATAIPGATELLAGVHDRIEVAVAEHDASGTLDEIRLEPAYCAAYVQLCGAAPDDDLLDELIRIEQRAWFAGVRLAPGALPMLEGLRAAGLCIGLCSNAPYHAATMREQLDHVGLMPLLDAVTLSSDAGRRKPAPELFRQALVDLGVAADDAVHVGDRVLEDVGGARSAGLRAVWLTSGAGAGGPAVEPDAIIDSLADVLPLLLGASSA
jgi:HAD superfamily hydrolase (TIGR01509 family)